MQVNENTSFFIIKQNGNQTKLRGNISQEEMVQVPELFKANRKTNFSQNGKQWFVWPIQNATLFMCVPKPEKVFENIHPVISLILILLGIFLAYLGFRWIILQQDTYLSLRWKMVGLFLYALFMPTFGLLLLAYQSFGQTKQILEEELRKTGLDTLLSIDDGFMEEARRFQSLMKSYHERFKNGNLLPNCKELLRRDFFNEAFTTLEWRDGAGEIIAEAGKPSAKDDFSKQFLKQIYLQSIQKHVPSRQKFAKEDSGSMFLSAAFGVDSSDFQKLVEKPGEIHRIRLPNLNTFFFWDYYDSQEHPAVLMGGALDIEYARDRYVRDSFQTIQQPGPVAMRLFAINSETNVWIPTYYNSNSLSIFAHRINQKSERQYTRIKVDGKNWLAVGIPGKQLTPYTLIALVSEENLIQTLLNFRYKILSGVPAMLAFALLLGWLLGDTLLQPISQLGLGIQAIKSQNTNFRLMAASKDELGDVSLAFNDMLEQLDELYAGKLVQEQLFPRGPIKVGEYEVAGVSQPATQLGGDYFDYVMANEEDFLVLIGDVTGHGVPAALIMAMSKAIVLTSIEANESPELLAEKLNRTIFSVMKRRRLLGLGLGWVNSRTHKIQYFHFGHTFPIIQRISGEMEFISATGFPLGSKSTKVLKPVEISLYPGDRIIFFTDGLVESFSDRNDIDCFQLFAKHISSLPKQAPAQSCQAIIDQHPFFKTGLPQPDDFTVLILERNEKRT